MRSSVDRRLSKIKSDYQHHAVHFFLFGNSHTTLTTISRLRLDNFGIISYIFVRKYLIRSNCFYTQLF